MPAFPRIVGRIGICEDSEYKLGLQRLRYDGEIENPSVSLFMFVVTIFSPLGVTTYHVLAKDAEAAIGQAKCVPQLEEYRLSAEYATLVRGEAVRVPLVIQGWGGQQF